MSTTTKRRSTTRAPKRDVQAEVTAKIVQALEAGTVPWHKPWRTAGLLPTSVSTGRAYRGANLLLLAMEGMIHDYDSPYWLTFNQAKALGGSVRKGEKGTQIILWKRTERDDPDNPDEKKVGFFLTFYTVFNVDQTDGVALPPRFAPEALPAAPDPIEAAEGIWNAYVDGPTLRYALGDSARYNSATDQITLPRREQFESADGYYNTLFHEATHSTGHASRLDRPMANPFGCDPYAREELVAELGAAMMNALAGIETKIESNAAYIDNWLGALNNDKTLVIKAAGQAQKAVDRIVGASFAPAQSEDAA